MGSRQKTAHPYFLSNPHPIGFIKKSLQGYFSVSTGTGMIVIFMVKLFNGVLFTDSFFLGLEAPKAYLFRYITDEICCYEQVIMEESMLVSGKLAPLKVYQPLLIVFLKVKLSIGVFLNVQWRWDDSMETKEGNGRPISGLYRSRPGLTISTA